MIPIYSSGCALTSWFCPGYSNTWCTNYSSGKYCCLRLKYFCSCSETNSKIIMSRYLDCQGVQEGCCCESRWTGGCLDPCIINCAGLTCCVNWSCDPHCCAPLKKLASESKTLRVMNRNILTKFDVPGVKFRNPNFVPIMGVCCFFSGCAAKNLVTFYSGSGKLCCIKGRFISCDFSTPSSEDECCVIQHCHSKCVNFDELCCPLCEYKQTRFFCLSSECYFPCTEENPCILTVCGLTCCVRSQCKIACCKTLDDLLRE